MEEGTPPEKGGKKAAKMKWRAAGAAVGSTQLEGQFAKQTYAERMEAEAEAERVLARAGAVGRGRCSGSVQVQYGGKGKFQDAWGGLAPGRPSLTFRKGHKAGAELRTANAEGCKVSTPKQGRKGHELTFRLDLVMKDSVGCDKYIFSVDTAEELIVRLHTSFGVTFRSLSFWLVR